MDPEYSEPAGRQHYRLLESLSAEVSGCTLFDIGTHKGMSALALASNRTNTVRSFDLVEKPGRPNAPNLHYHTDDLMSPEGRSAWAAELLASPLIFLDIDPHEGTREYAFYEWLRDNDYKGQLICDDIWHFKEMRDKFWYKIPSEHKTDLTERGHWSGTGRIRFHPPSPSPPSNWTVVTAYFDLTRMPDASPSIRARPASYYLEYATSTLAVDQNLVVFCEPDRVDAIRALRPAHLASKTQYIAMSFEDFPLCAYRQRLTENRKVHPPRDDRNTVSYYLFCMARYAMLKRVLSENPFGSTHFAWLNFCIERMGVRNLIELPRVFEAQRDKISTCYIDYAPPEMLDEVVRTGQCTMCSGFFTGDATHMKLFCDQIEETFLAYLKKGLGHADEQLYSPVYMKNPSLFEVYYGDYQEMITNYVLVKDRASRPIYQLIKHAYDAGGYAVALPACIAVWRSWKKGHAHLTESEVSHLIWYYRKSLEALGLSTELE
jgi:hypothetical protein